MQTVFTSNFTTVDITPPESDLSKISVVIPENGYTTVKGTAGSVEPGSTVTVFNPKNGKTVNMTVLSDGSFELSIEANVGDNLTIRIIDSSGNILDVKSKPFVSNDGRSVILGTEAYEYITPDGYGIKIEEGTFGGFVTVGLFEETNPLVLSDMPNGFSRLKSLSVDLGGLSILKNIKISIPAPAGLTTSY